MSLGVYARRIRRLRRAVIEADLSPGVIRSPRGDAAGEPRIARIPDQARRTIVQVPVCFDGTRVDVIVQLQVVVLNLTVEIGVRTAYERVLRPDALHFRGAMRVEVRQRIAQFVVQRRIGNTHESALAVQHGVISKAPVVHVAARTQAAQAQRIAMVQGIDDIHGPADPRSAGKAVAEIIQRNVSRDGGNRRRVDHQIRGTNGLPRFQGRVHGDSRHIGEQQEGVIQRLLTDGLPALHGG